ncbi:hypothetical protein BT96DRAFT_497270 [Gymnopus androsaceus JB14]|uniref:Uncharacterized protein n=1 Tax=Gymnopus androsaceus JB14 TaxID=1447944 RepID=A0A6A4GMQ2_9AGAR|nr:hypothetical protein BT96DRAFT_497270 [Gymnopus androsaceus JB14]
MTSNTLLPSFLLPSPITPTSQTSNYSADMVSASPATVDFSESETCCTALEPSLSHAVASSGSTQSANFTHVSQSWITCADPDFSHSQSPIHTPKKGNLEHIDRAMDISKTWVNWIALDSAIQHS